MKHIAYILCAQNANSMDLLNNHMTATIDVKSAVIHAIVYPTTQSAHFDHTLVFLYEHYTYFFKTMKLWAKVIKC